MRKNRIITMSLREIKKSLKRFFSLCVLSFLGVSFFVGMKMSGPTMLKSLDKYYDENRVYDFKVNSSLGLDDDDVSEIKKLSDSFEVVPSHSKDGLFFDGKYEQVLRIHEINENINNLIITEGRMPEKNNEILVEDGVYKKSENKIGDIITLNLEEDDDTLKTKELEIVGYVLSPEYVNKTEVSQSRGNTKLGNGQVGYYAYALSSLFNMDYYSEIFVLENKTTKYITHTDDYLKVIDKDEEKLASIKETRQNERYIKIIEESTKKVDEEEKEANEEFEKAESELNDAKTKLDNAKTELDNAKTELDKGKSELDKNKTKLDNAKRDIQNGTKEISKAKEKLANALVTLNNSKSEIDRTISSYNITYDKLSSFVKKYDSSSFSVSDIIKIFSDNNIDINNMIESSTVNIKALAYTFGINLDSLFSSYGLDKDLLNNSYIVLDEVIDAATINQLKRMIFDDSFITLVKGSIPSNVPYYNDIQKYLSDFIVNNDNILKLFDAVRKVDNGYSDYNKNLNLVNSKETELNNASKQYDKGLKDYNSGLKTYNSSLEFYNNSLDEYNSNLDLYNKNKQEYEDKKQEVTEKINLAREKIKKIEKATWFIQTREDNNEYLTFISSYDSINNLSNLFPVIFYLVSVMISLLAMARMAIENRSEIGTLKALGFSNFDVRLKFVFYATFATLIGGILGAFIGYKTIPKIIIGIFNIMHNVPEFVYDTNHMPIILGIGISLLCIVGSTIITINNLVKEKTTELLRPIAPPIGKKIFFEKISFIWDRFSYSTKLTIRNIFRYKRRIFMSIFGIASCTMILLSGYGIKDSISFVVDKQYNSINHNDVLISLDGKAEELELNEYIKDEDLSFNVYARIDQVEINNKRVSLIVPNDYEDFKKTLTIRDVKTKKEITLTDNTVVVTQKLAKFLKKKVGDTITIMESDNLPYDFTITNISENYIGDYVYFNKHMYTKNIDEYKINTQYIGLNDLSKENDIMTSIKDKNTHILSTVSVSAVKAQCVQLFKSLNVIVYVLVLFTAVLSFVVFYSLAYINISERQREIATVKVLGYYNREVDNYIMKEEFIITVLGILVGLFVGTYYAYAMIDSIEINTMQYIKDIQFMSYVQTFGFMLVFTAIVSVGVHFKLKKIDLIESLKSVE